MKIKNKMKVHINCSPYIEDGTWHIIKEHDYKCHHHDDKDFEAIRDELEAQLENRKIHSFYIERPSEKKPILHKYN
jgi:hypothetical protein